MVVVVQLDRHPCTGDALFAAARTDPQGDSDGTDIKQHPEKIKALSPGLAERITALTNGILVNLDDEIDGDVAL